MYRTTDNGRGGSKPMLHDCGEFGELTAREIADRAGVSLDCVYLRVDRGVSGAGLLAPREHGGWCEGNSYREDQPATCGNTGVAMAVRLARAFQHRPPTVEELRQSFGMSRATAYRWRAAFRDAMGLSA